MNLFTRKAGLALPASAATVVDERNALPEFSDVRSLLTDLNGQGRALVIRGGVHYRASELSSSYQSKAGGAIVPDWWQQDPDVYFSDVFLFRLRDVLYYPEYGVLKTAVGEVMKSTFAAANYVLGDPSALPATPRKIEKIERAVVTFPWGANTNYGHFVLDCLPAIALARQIPELAEYDYVFPTLKQWHRRHLRLAGLSKHRELSTSVYRIRDAIFTSCMDHFLHWPNGNLKLLRDIEVLNAKSTFGTPSLIYLSRKGDQKRNFGDEWILEDGLKALSFAIIDPTQHDIDEQIAIFRGADVVVGCAGAAFANVLYCRPSTKVIEIQPQHMPGIWVRNICALIGCQWLPFFCDSAPPDQPLIVDGRERPELGISYRAEVDDIVRFVMNNGPKYKTSPRAG